MVAGRGRDGGKLVWPAEAVEKVARAIAYASCGSEMRWMVYRAEAKAALWAMFKHQEESKDND